MTEEAATVCDITVCALCTRQQCAAKLLPCLHSFCLRCLERIASDQRRPLGDEEMTCPTCADTFKIPDEGLVALPSNSFVENLVLLRKGRDEEENDLGCDVCASEAAKSSPVTSRCLDCRQNMCELCSGYHAKFASTRDHKVVHAGKWDTGDSVGMEDIDRCDRHPDRRQELYCRDCESAVCLRCYTDKHNSHTCSDIRTVGDEFRGEMRKNVEDLDQLRIESESDECDLRRARDDILDQVTEAEFTVLRRREELVSCIERDTNELMNDLHYFRDVIASEFDVCSDKIRKRSEKISSFSRFTREVLSKGSSSTTANIASALNQRASEIRAHCAKCRNRRRPSVEVVFQPLGLARLSQAENVRKVNLVGRITASIIQPEPTTSELRNTTPDSLSTTALLNCLQTMFQFFPVSESPIPRRRPIRLKWSNQFLLPERSARSCGIDRSARPSRQSDEAVDSSSSSDDEDVQDCDEDVSTQPAAEAVKEDETGSVKEDATLETFYDTSSLTVMFSHEAKLYRFSNGSWRRRGVGDIEVLRLREKNVAYLVMRNKQVGFLLQYFSNCVFCHKAAFLKNYKS